MIGTRQFGKADQLKVEKYFYDQQIANLLISQLKQVYESETCKNFTLSLTSQRAHLYLYFHKNLTTSKEMDDQEQGQYVVKITKGFPLSGVRVHILNNSYLPRLFDCRDIMEEILSDKWTYKTRLLQIFANIHKFQDKLSQRNKRPLSMQKTGEFKLGDIFDDHELKKFLALDTFQDISKEDGPVLGTTQTHLITFKRIPQKQKHALKLYQLVRACEIQCANEIYHYKKTGQIILTLYKYKNIKSFNEYEKISKKYKFEDPELFMRNILKNIGQFQKVQVALQTGNGWKNQVDFQKTSKRIQQCKHLQQKLHECEQQSEIKKIEQELIVIYHKLIDYFSQRANAYYLIYVTKLNEIYSRQSSIST